MKSTRIRVSYITSVLQVCNDTVNAAIDIHHRVSTIVDEKGILEAVKILKKSMDNMKSAVFVCSKTSKTMWALTGKKLGKAVEEAIKDLKESNTLCFQNLQIWATRLNLSSNIERKSEDETSLGVEMIEEIKDVDLMSELKLDDDQFACLKGIIELKWATFLVAELIQKTQSIQLQIQKLSELDRKKETLAKFFKVHGKFALGHASRRNSIIAGDREHIGQLITEFQNEDRSPSPEQISKAHHALSKVQKELKSNSREPIKDMEEIERIIRQIERVSCAYGPIEAETKSLISEMNDLWKSLDYSHLAVDPIIICCLKDAEKRIFKLNENFKNASKESLSDDTKLLENLLFRAEKNMFGELLVQNGLITSSDSSGGLGRNLLQIDQHLKRLESLQGDVLNNSEILKRLMLDKDLGYH
jgi:hypothetical protein